MFTHSRGQLPGEDIIEPLVPFRQSHFVDEGSSFFLRLARTSGAMVIYFPYIRLRSPHYREGIKCSTIRFWKRVAELHSEFNFQNLGCVPWCQPHAWLSSGRSAFYLRRSQQVNGSQSASRTFLKYWEIEIKETLEHMYLRPLSLFPRSVLTSEAV